MTTGSFLKICGAVVCFFACAGISPAQSCLPPPNGMTAWYPGDGNANDLLGAGSGVAQNGAAFAPGKVGLAFSLNGIDQYVALPPNFLPYPARGSTSSAPLSFDAWFQTRAGGVILGQQGDATPPTLPNGWVPAIYVGTDGFLYAELFWGGGPPISSAPRKVNDAVFHHVAVTYDGTVEQVYLDGAPIGWLPFRQVGYATTYYYQIGAGYTASWPAANFAYSYFQGLIDEVEFFGRALSPGEVQAIFTAGSAGKCKPGPPPPCALPPPGMKAWYPGDGNARDLLGVNDGLLQNGAAFAPGKVGPAFSFSGPGQFVALPANLLPYPARWHTRAAPVSVDAWFQTSAGGVIVGQQGDVSPPAIPNGAVPAIYVGVNGMLYAELFWGGVVAPVSSAPRRVNDGLFHHVVVTYDGSVQRLYLDGVLLGSTPLIQTGYAAAYQYQIGAGYTVNWPAGNGGYLYFNGLIDEVEFFTRALSDAEVQAIFSAGSSGKCKALPPVAKCKDVTVAAGPQGTADASIDNGSYSPIPGSAITLTQAPPGPYSVGHTPVTLTVTDNRGAASQCTGTVTVIAANKLQCGSLAAAPDVLWPPNHKMVPVSVTAASRGCPAASCEIVGVRSNERDDDRDWVITGKLTVNLRAARAGKGTGRVYTILVECVNASGSRSGSAVTVTVPHDRSHGNGHDDHDKEDQNGGRDRP